MAARLRGALGIFLVLRDAGVVRLDGEAPHGAVRADGMYRSAGEFRERRSERYNPCYWVMLHKAG